MQLTELHYQARRTRGKPRRWIYSIQDRTVDTG